MPLPFDLEDVLGETMASVLKRFFAVWTCITCGWVTVFTAYTMVGFAAGVIDGIRGHGWGGMTPDLPDAGGLIMALLFGGAIPLASSLAPLHAALLIGVVLYFFKAEEPHPYTWVVLAGAVSIMTFLAVFVDDFSYELLIVLTVWAILQAGIFLAAKGWLVRSRHRAEQHLVGVAIENEQRRQEIKARTGGAVADREFALGDQEE